MSLSFLSRYAFFAVCVIFTLASLPFLEHEWLWPITPVTGVLSLIGLFDLLQSPHAVRRNYPILGNIRYLVEAIRPEIRQYLLESDSDALPFSRAQRSLVYSRAKNETADKPFGTLIDVYQSGFEFIGHSMRPAPLSDPEQFSRHGRRPAVHAAVFGVGVQHLGDEFRLTERQRHSRAEPGREAWQLCPRHRRRQHQPLSP